MSSKPLFFGVRLLRLESLLEDMLSAEVSGRGAALFFGRVPEDGAELLPDEVVELLLGNGTALSSEYEAELLLDNGESLSSELEVVFSPGDIANLLSESGEEDGSPETGAVVPCDNGVETGRLSENGVELPWDDGAQLLSDNVGPGAGFFRRNLRREGAFTPEDSGAWTSLPVAVLRRRSFFCGRAESFWGEVERISGAGLAARLLFLLEDLFDSERCFLTPTSSC
jgi:hypothetical protein